VVLTVAVVFALVRTVRRDGPAALAAWRAADVDPAWIAFAGCAGLAGHLIFVVGWRRLLSDCGIRIAFWQTARIFLASNLGRYLPAGKAWQMSIVGVMAAERNLPAVTVATSSLFHGLLGVVIGALLLVATGGTALGVPTGWLVVPAAALVALIALPAGLRRFPALRASLIRRAPTLEAVTAGTMWALVWTTTVSWFAWAASLYGLALGLLPDPQASFASYVAAWIAPFLAGLLAIFTPAGLGVRDELMRTLLVEGGVSAGGAILVVVVARLATTILDVVPAIAVLGLRRVRAPATSSAAAKAAGSGPVSNTTSIIG
jgi:uncharacterized membrane protein YbhN (UPF0104 family)